MGRASVIEAGRHLTRGPNHSLPSGRNAREIGVIYLNVPARHCSRLVSEVMGSAITRNAMRCKAADAHRLIST